MVNKLGKHAGEVHACMRLIPGRSPGKVRDALGVEHIDEQLMNAGQMGAPREMNQRSPRKSRDV